jgi:hypothetical protein
MNMKLGIFIFLTLSGLRTSSQSFDPVALGYQKATLNRVKEKVKVERIYLSKPGKNEQVHKKGSLVNEIYYNEQGKITKSSNFFPRTTITENEYDERGNQIKMVNKTKAGAIRQSLVLDYDDNDILVQVRSYDPKGKMISIKDIREKTEGDYTVSYDTKGGVISKSYKNYDPVTKTFTSKLINSDGTIRYEDIYLLSDDYLILEWSNINHMQPKRWVTKYSYDKNGNQTEELLFDAAGKLTEKKVTTYNDKNLISQKTLYKPADKPFQVFTYEYAF